MTKKHRLKNDTPEQFEIFVRLYLRDVFGCAKDKATNFLVCSKTCNREKVRF